MHQTATASLMRRMNRAAVLNLMRRESPLPRIEIAKRLKLSLPTVMRIVDDLVVEDLVRPQGTAESTKGRPRELLEFNGASYAAIGVDLGGTKIFGTVADLSGTVEHEIYLPDANGCSDSALDRLCELIEGLLSASRPSTQRIRGIGIGAPGLVASADGVVHWAPSLGWQDLPLRDLLAERFGVPVYVENDVNLAALGEWGFGAGQGTEHLVCMAVGTGIGLGIIINGSLYRGHNQAAGEIGYLPPGVEFLGRSYPKFGALESLASGTGIAERARRVREAAGMPVDGMTAEDVFAAARAGESWAQRVVDETVDYLSLAICCINSVLDPEVVILGGGVARSADLLMEPIQRRIKGVSPYTPRLVASSLGFRAAVMGAIMLVLNATITYPTTK